MNKIVNTVKEQNYLRIPLTLTGKCRANLEHIKYCCQLSPIPFELHFFANDMKDKDDLKRMLCFIEGLTYIDDICVSSVHAPEKLSQPQIQCFGYSVAGPYTVYVDLDTLQEHEVMEAWAHDKTTVDCDAINLMRTCLAAELISIIGLNDPYRTKESRIETLNKLKTIYEEVKDVSTFLKVCGDTYRFQKKVEPVVLHGTCNLNSLVRYNLSSSGEIANSIKTLLEYFPNIELAFENTTPRFFNRKSYSMSDIGNPLSTVMVVERLQENLINTQINPKRLGTVFDYCHYLMSCDYMNTDERFPLTDVIKSQEEHLKLIHLADSKEDGMGKNHGVVFEENNFKSLDNLAEFMVAYSNVYEKVSTPPPIVLEVQEPTYPSVLNREKFLQILKERCCVKAI